MAKRRTCRTTKYQREINHLNPFSDPPYNGRAAPKMHYPKIWWQMQCWYRGLPTKGKIADLQYWLSTVHPEVEDYVYNQQKRLNESSKGGEDPDQSAMNAHGLADAANEGNNTTNQHQREGFLEPSVSDSQPPQSAIPTGFGESIDLLISEEISTCDGFLINIEPFQETQAQLAKEAYHHLDSSSQENSTYGALPQKESQPQRCTSTYHPPVSSLTSTFHECSADPTTFEDDYSSFIETMTI